jgi:hypothetical protein
MLDSSNPAAGRPGTHHLSVIRTVTIARDICSSARTRDSATVLEQRCGQDIRQNRTIVLF